MLVGFNCFDPAPGLDRVLRDPAHIRRFDETCFPESDFSVHSGSVLIQDRSGPAAPDETLEKGELNAGQAAHRKKYRNHGRQRFR